MQKEGSYPDDGCKKEVTEISGAGMLCPAIGICSLAPKGYAMKRLSIISTCLFVTFFMAPSAFPEEGQRKTIEKKAEQRESVKKSHEAKGERDATRSSPERSMGGGSAERTIGGCPEGPPCKKRTIGSPVIVEGEK